MRLASAGPGANSFLFKFQCTYKFQCRLFQSPFLRSEMGTACGGANDLTAPSAVDNRARVRGLRAPNGLRRKSAGSSCSIRSMCSAATRTCATYPGSPRRRARRGGLDEALQEAVHPPVVLRLQDPGGEFARADEEAILELEAAHRGMRQPNRAGSSAPMPSTRRVARNKICTIAEICAMLGREVESTRKKVGASRCVIWSSR